MLATGCARSFNCCLKCYTNYTETSAAATSPPDSLSAACTSGCKRFYGVSRKNRAISRVVLKVAQLSRLIGELSNPSAIALRRTLTFRSLNLMFERLVFYFTPNSYYRKFTTPYSNPKYNLHPTLWQTLSPPNQVFSEISDTSR